MVNIPREVVPKDFLLEKPTLWMPARDQKQVTKKKLITESCLEYICHLW